LAPLLTILGAMVAGMLYAGVALAAPVNEVEPNDSIAQAQNIDSYFSLDSDPNITDSTTVPHATVDGTGNGTFDYYSFRVNQAGVSTIGVFDIDNTLQTLDSYLQLYDSNGALIAFNDDAPADAGSTSGPYFCSSSDGTCDSYLQYNFPSAGTYYISVGSCNFFDCPQPVPNGTSYKLNVSVPNHNYDWDGFFRPVDNPEVATNKAKAGSAIPVKFSLGGDQGLDIFESGYPKSGTMPCDSSDPVDDLEQTVTAGSSSLSYDATTDTYTYVWKTDKAWANTCRQLVVKLNDGSTEHVANFQFVK
jgi:hypothetical protein